MPKKDMIFYLTVSADTDSTLGRITAWVTEQITEIVTKSRKGDVSVALYNGKGERQSMVVAGNELEVPPAVIPVLWNQPPPE